MIKCLGTLKLIQQMEVLYLGEFSFGSNVCYYVLCMSITFDLLLLVDINFS